MMVSRGVTKKAKGPPRPTKRPFWLLPMDDDQDIKAADEEAAAASTDSKSRSRCTERPTDRTTGPSTCYKRALQVMIFQAGSPSEQMSTLLLSLPRPVTTSSDEPGWILRMLGLPRNRLCEDCPQERPPSLTGEQSSGPSIAAPSSLWRAYAAHVAA